MACRGYSDPPELRGTSCCQATWLVGATQTGQGPAQMTSQSRSIVRPNTRYSSVSFVFHLATENKSPFLDTTEMDVNGSDERNRLALKASRCARPLPVPISFPTSLSFPVPATLHTLPKHHQSRPWHLASLPHERAGTLRTHTFMSNSGTCAFSNRIAPMGPRLTSHEC